MSFAFQLVNSLLALFFIGATIALVVLGIKALNKYLDSDQNEMKRRIYALEVKVNKMQDEEESNNKIEKTM